MTNSHYAIVKSNYHAANDRYLDKLEELKKQTIDTNLKQEELINKWPANSPVLIYYLILGFKSD